MMAVRFICLAVNFMIVKSDICDIMQVEIAGSRRQLPRKGKPYEVTADSRRRFLHL